eukprot:gene5475-6159_t
MTKNQVPEDVEEFWTPPETVGGKFKRKIKENPLVPAGMAATVAALVYGIYGFQKGDQKLQQRMMRTRVIAQGATVAVLVGGIALAAIKSTTKKE